MNNMDNPSAFSQEQVVSEPTEIEKIQNRVKNFAVRLKPATAEAIKGSLTIGLANGLFKMDDLDAIVAIREEIAKGLIEYQSTVQQAQKDLTGATERESQRLQDEFESQKQRDHQVLIDERLLRKRTQDRLAQMEQVLKDQGLHIDLDGDGLIGLKEGQVADTLTEVEQAEVSSLLKEPSVSEHSQAELEPIPDFAPAPRPTSSAFKLARMLNPVQDETIERDYDEEVLEVDKKRFADFVEDTPPQIAGGLIQGEDTESFLDEVARVGEVQDADETDEDVDFQDTAEFYNGEPEPVVEEPTLDIGYSSPAPVVTAGNAPNITGVAEVTQTPIAAGVYVEHTPEPVVGENDVVISKDKIKVFAEHPQEEDDFDEVVIPNRKELQAMTKKGILGSAEKLSFTIDKKLTKAKMVNAFEDQSNTLIEELTTGEEFVSASEEEVDGDDDRRDGGYF